MGWVGKRFSEGYNLCVQKSSSLPKIEATNCPLHESRHKGSSERIHIKTKTKLVLAASSLSCTVFGCLGSATFAWFVTQNNVGVQYSQLTIASASPNLSLILTQIVPSAASPITLNSVQTIDDAISFSDVSSQFGDTFYEETDSTDAAFAEVSSSALAGKILQFGVCAKYLSVSTAMKLNFQPSIAVSAADTASSASTTSWVRMAIYQCTNSTYRYRTSGGCAYAFMSDKTLDASKHFINGTQSTSIGSYGTDELCNYSDSVTLKDSITDAGSAFFKVSIWLEGTASTNQDAARDATVSMTTKFSLSQS